MFESEFAKTQYIAKDNAVFHVWKKEAHFDDSRKSVTASLEMLRMYPDSLFIVDARKGLIERRVKYECKSECFCK